MCSVKEGKSVRPFLLVVGGLRYAGQLAFDRVHNYSFCNLFVTMLQRRGIETARFASNSSTMRGL